MEMSTTKSSISKAKSWKKLALVGACCVAMPLMLNGCGLIIAAGAGGAGVAAVQQDSRSIYNMAYDEGIEQNAYRFIKSNSVLSKPEDLRIAVTAFNGNVLITGQTINRDYLKWVVKQIEGLEHVRKVYNYATLQKPVPSTVVSSDAIITSKIKAQLLFGKDINSNRFKVITENGNVFLMGIVNRDESKRAINTVLGIDGVRKVYHIFDYIDDTVYKGNGAQVEEKITVSPQKGSASDYQKPQRNSSYVPPVQNQQNGGAYIMDEPMDSGPSSLLAPASEY
ncbi:BON domain-containing protein [Anaerobiospirillum sp. NML120448]|uniref:BON domain-containing protein n=1 Tax=Anaerobiospirillum sp. NML120448 TaxID=2932816 RepID=UPI001FF50141|nr:BON domain-containing protein [Anaerobiospirillum sp. NML120448]MCK0515396.1 BON domain-containing protein [Anaerobiospirillum sp. NML120448]